MSTGTREEFPRLYSPVNDPERLSLVRRTSGRQRCVAHCLQTFQSCWQAKRYLSSMGNSVLLRQCVYCQHHPHASFLKLLKATEGKMFADQLRTHCGDSQEHCLVGPGEYSFPSCSDCGLPSPHAVPPHRLTSTQPAAHVRNSPGLLLCCSPHENCYCKWH